MKALLLALALASHGADAYYTNAVIQNHGHESDPLAKPFVHGTAWCAVSSGVNVTAVLYGVHLLRKHHHGKLANMLEAGDITAHSVYAGRTANAYYSRPR